MEREHYLGRLAQRDASMAHYRRHQPLETDPLDQQLTLDDRMIDVGHRAERRSHGANETLALAFWQTEAGREQPFSVRLEPDAAIFVDDDVGDLRVGNRAQQLRSELPSQKLVPPAFLDLLRR